eukprot:351828-Chlamydomonas_euryale.AAC.4
MVWGGSYVASAEKQGAKCAPTWRRASTRARQSCKALERASGLQILPTPCPHHVHTLPATSQALPKRKHIKLITRSALLEFRSGSAERGRSIYESVLRNYPKRLDLWSQYIDQVWGVNAARAEHGVSINNLDR